jgi:uncharacterized protein YyaL (SSP411 family)
MLLALEEHLDPPTLVLIRGSAAESEEWRAELTKLYAPKRLVFAIPNDAAGLPTNVAAKVGGMETVGYVCRGTTCSEPLRSLSALVALAHA